MALWPLEPETPPEPPVLTTPPLAPPTRVADRTLPAAVRAAHRSLTAARVRRGSKPVVPIQDVGSPASEYGCVQRDDRQADVTRADAASKKL